MTTTAAPRSTGVLADLRDIPTRFVVLAGVSAALLLLMQRSTHWSIPFDPNAYGFLWPIGASLTFVAGLAFAVAPLVALRTVFGGAALALLPLIAFPFVGTTRWSLTMFVALVAVAMVGVWRSRAAAVAVAMAALLLVGTLVLGLTNMAAPFGYDIVFNYRGLLSLAVSFALYAGAVAVALGIALWMRSSALVARRETALVARSAEVEGEATVVGERARLAHDLHDVVAHHVSLIAVRAETAPFTYPDLQPEAKVVLSEIATDARRALDELRGVLGVLRRAEDDAPSRAPQPKLADVMDLVDSARTTGAKVSVEGDLTTSVGSTNGYVAYRVVQEALTNARRHAVGQPVTVAVRADGPRLLVRVTNPYLAASKESGGAQRGLAGMRERVGAIGGRLTAEVRGDYFVVEADLPRGEQ